VDPSSFEVRSAGATLVGARAGDGLPALILHGGPGLSDYTETLADELSQVFTTLRYTQRGVPPSSVAGPFRVEDHVADAIGVLDALDVRSAWVVGHSWGGHLAMHVAVAEPDRVSGLICVDSLGATGDGGYTAFAETLGERYERARGRPLPEDAPLEEYWEFYFADSVAAPPMPPMDSNPDAYAEAFESLRGHFERRTLEEGLRLLAVPALFVHGRESPLPVSASEEAATLMPDARVRVLDGCGHFPWLEQPGVVADAALELLPVA
jgi:pimeloyl-ACP methyl ester carboxylesterase